MQDPPQHIEETLTTTDRLLLEKVMRLKRNPASDVVWNIGSSFSHHFGQILDNEIEIWQPTSQLDAKEAMRSADVDDSCAPASLPVKKIEDMATCETWAILEEHHRTLVALKAVWVLANCTKKPLLFVVCKIESLNQYIE